MVAHSRTPHIQIPLPQHVYRLGISLMKKISHVAAGPNAKLVRLFCLVSISFRQGTAMKVKPGIRSLIFLIFATAGKLEMKAYRLNMIGVTAEIAE